MISKSMKIIFIAILSLLNVACTKDVLKQTISLNEEQERMTGREINKDILNQHILDLQVFLKYYFKNQNKEDISFFISQDKQDDFYKEYFSGWFELPESHLTLELKDIEIISMKHVEEGISYTVDVVTKQEVVDKEKGYIAYRYNLIVVDNETLKIKSIKCADALSASQKWYIPYDKEIGEEEKGKIIKILKILCEKDLDFFADYEHLWLTDYESWKVFLESRGISDKMLLAEGETYKDNYSLYLSPYKMPNETIIFNWGEALFEIDACNTEINHRFIVKIPAEVLRDYDNKLYYNYEYLVGLNRGNVASIKFIKREPR